MGRRGSIGRSCGSALVDLADMTNILAQTSRGRPRARRRPRRGCAGGRYLVVRSPRGRGLVIDRPRSFASTIRWWEMSPLTSTSHPAAAAAAFAIRRRPATRQTMRRSTGRRGKSHLSVWNRSITRSTRSVHESANAPMRQPAPWVRDHGVDVEGGRPPKVNHGLRRWHENRDRCGPLRFARRAARVPSVHGAPRKGEPTFVAPAGRDVSRMYQSIRDWCGIAGAALSI